MDINNFENDNILQESVYSLKLFTFDEEVKQYNAGKIKFKSSSSFNFLRDFTFYANSQKFFSFYRPHMDKLREDPDFRKQLFDAATKKFRYDGLLYVLFFYIREILPTDYYNKKDNYFFEDLLDYAKNNENLTHEVVNQFYFGSYLLYHEFNLPERFNLKTLIDKNYLYVNLYHELYTSGIKNKKLVSKIFPIEEMKQVKYSRRSHSCVSTEEGEELVDIKTKFQLTILYNNTNSIKRFKRAIDYFDDIGLNTNYDLLHRVINPKNIKHQHLMIINDPQINNFSYSFEKESTTLENISKYNSMISNLQVLLNKNEYGYITGFNKEKLSNFMEAGLYYSQDAFLKPHLLSLIEAKAKKAQYVNKAKWNNLNLEINIHKTIETQNTSRKTMKI